jgi:hypothetical protein
MSPVTRGELQIMNPKAIYRECARGAAITFVAGALLGSGLALTFSPSAGGPRLISAALIGIGEHLCKSHEGLANVARLSDIHYTFECRELATFPKVEVTLQEP